MLGGFAHKFILGTAGRLDDKSVTAMTLAFSVQSGVRSMNEVFRWHGPPKPDRMMSGKARFRVVLTMGK